MMIKQPRKAFLVLFLILFIGVTSALADDLLKQGDKAPEFSTTTFDGSSFSLAGALKESPVLLVFIRGFS